MSTWLSWGRQKLGLEAEAPTTRNTNRPRPSPQEMNQKSQALLNSQKMQLRQMESQLKDINKDIEMAEQTGNARSLAALIKKRNLHVFQMNQLSNKMGNHETTQRALGAAEQNLEQARIMEHTAGQMEDVMKEIQEIDIDEVVDKLHDQIGLSTDYTNRLGEPLFDEMYGMEADDTGLDIDAEVAMRLQRVADERAAQMPEKSNGGGSDGSSGGQKVEAAAEAGDKREIKKING